MSTLAGTHGLVRLILRRDRLLLPIWVLWLAILPIQTALATDQLFPTAQARREYFDTIAANPGLVGFLGPVFNASLGALTAWRVGMAFVVVGLLSLLTVIRHTRTDEEAGRRELLGSTVVGRQAPLAAALLVTFAADLLLAAILTLGMTAIGLPLAGSLALGLSLVAAGWMFAAVAAVAAQLTDGAGGARGIAVGALGLAFLLRAAGDAGGQGGSLSWLSWASPLGLAQRARPYAGERWWVLAVAAGLVVLLVAAAVALLSRRDVGAGILPARLGRATAAPGLRSPLALAWRLHRGMLFGWTAGFALGGVVIGGVAKSTSDMAAQSAQLQTIIERLGGGASIADAYLAAVMGLLGVAAAGYATQATLRLRAEEEALRADQVLATPAGRLPWAASHLLFGVIGPAAALTGFGLTAGLVHGLMEGDVSGQLPRVLAGALVQLLAVWVLCGIATAVFGLLPRLVSVAWGALAVFGFLALLGPLLQLDQVVMDVSPFSHVPKLPGGQVSLAPLLWLLGLAVVLAAAGLRGFRRRDVGVA